MDKALDSSWLELVSQLEGQTSALAQHYLRELKDQGVYETSGLSEAELLIAAEESYESLVASLAGDRDKQKTFAKNLGTRRARQGVSLEALSFANRLDFRILWRRLNEIIPAGQNDLLVDHMELMLTVVEDYTLEVQRAYLVEKAKLQNDSELSIERQLSMLFYSQTLSAKTVDDTARLISVDKDGVFDVLSINDDSVTLGDLALSYEEKVYKYSQSLFIFRQVDDGTSGSFVERFEGIPGIYFPGVQGLSALPSLARASIELHQSHPDLTRPTDLKSLWGSAIKQHFEEILPGYLEHYLKPLEELSDYKRKDMLDTVREYLLSGSVKETAEKLFCHRNTVDFRLRKFSALTGLDISIPSEGGLAHIILAQLR